MLRKRVIPLLLTLCLLGLLSAGASAENATDESLRERQMAALRWTGHGLPGGSEPLDLREGLSRGAAAQMLATLLGLQERGDISGYSDIPEDSLYREAIEKCVAAGILSGYGGGRMAPEEPVSREMFQVMLARGLRIAPEKAEGGWAAGAVAALERRGYTAGGDPAETLTGREALYLLDRTIASYANQARDTVRGNGGLCLLAAPETVVTGSVNDLVISAGAEGGTITLDNASVSGEVIVCARVTLVLAGASSIGFLRLTPEAEDTQIVLDEGATLGEVDAGEEPAPEESPAPEETPEPTPEPSPSPEVNALPNWALNVGPGAVVDADRPQEPPYTEYTVSAEAAAAEAAWDVLVSVHMTGLRPHRSSAGTAFWTGFSIAAPADATGYRVAYSTDGAGYTAAEAYLLRSAAFSRYFDASRWTEYYVRLTWLRGDAEEGEPVTYKIDLTDVELDASALTEADSPLGQISAAALWDLTEGADHKDVLYRDYGVAVENRKDENGSYLEITVRAEGLESYRTAGGEGHWAGVSVAAPAGAEGCRYSVYLSLENARKNFTGKPLISREQFFRNIDGAGADGVRQLTDAGKEDQRDYWMILQWYGGEEGVTSLTTPVVYHIVLDVTLAEELPADFTDEMGENLADGGHEMD